MESYSVTNENFRQQENRLREIQRLMQIVAGNTADLSDIENLLQNIDTTTQNIDTTTQNIDSTLTNLFNYFNRSYSGTPHNIVITDLSAGDSYATNTAAYSVAIYFFNSGTGLIDGMPFDSSHPMIIFTADILHARSVPSIACNCSTGNMRIIEML